MSWMNDVDKEKRLEKKRYAERQRQEAYALKEAARKKREEERLAELARQNSEMGHMFRKWDSKISSMMNQMTIKWGLYGNLLYRFFGVNDVEGAIIKGFNENYCFWRVNKTSSASTICIAYNQKRKIVFSLSSGGDWGDEELSNGGLAKIMQSIYREGLRYYPKWVRR